MAIVPIDKVSGHEGVKVIVKGWVRHRRSSGKLGFMTVRDGTGDLQVVVSKAAVGEEQFALCGQLTQESSIIVTGMVRQDARAPGGYELDASELEVVAKSWASCTELDGIIPNPICRHAMTSE